MTFDLEKAPAPTAEKRRSGSWTIPLLPSGTGGAEEVTAAFIGRLTRIAELREDRPGHPGRVGALAVRIARAIDLPEDVIEALGLAAPLHDFGTLMIPDSIMKQAGRLEREEMEIIKTHTTRGAELLGGTDVPVLQLAAEIALTHHERWNGGGYWGVRGDEIPASGRIVALADVYDTLTHDRPYKRAWTHDEALWHVEHESGNSFDPRLVEAFMSEVHNAA